MKKKLKLDLNQLKVESFETVVRHEDREGTVFGNSTYPCTGETCDQSCVSCITCDPLYRTCNPMTCDHTCPACETVDIC